MMVGRFLAKDKGVTLDVSRRCKTGLRLGFFATITDVSDDEFGEGKLDWTRDTLFGTEITNSRNIW